MNILKEYGRYLRYAGVKIPPIILLSSTISITIIGLLFSLATNNFSYFVLLLLFADLMAAFPYYQGRKKIQEIEDNLSDAIRQMAAVLRSGGTFEVALREIAASDYGQLSKEFAQMLKEVEGGKAFTAALGSMARRVGSKYLEKITTIITDAVKTGGKVADVLDEIAEDIRKFNQVRRERKAKTTMQFMFIVISAVVLGPFLMGIAIGIVKFMMGIGKDLLASGVISAQLLAEKEANVNILSDVLTLFVVIEAGLAAFMGAIMREGRASYGLVLAPVFIAVAYFLFLAGIRTVFIITGG